MFSLWFVLFRLSLSFSFSLSLSLSLSACRSLLSPNFLLDPHSRGTLWTLTLNVSLILSASFQTRVVVPFLMRRRENAGTIRRLCLERLGEIIAEATPGNDSLLGWIESWAEGYKTCGALSPEDGAEKGGGGGAGGAGAGGRRESATVSVMRKMKERYKSGLYSPTKTEGGGGGADEKPAISAPNGDSSLPGTPTAAGGVGGGSGGDSTPTGISSPPSPPPPGEIAAASRSSAPFAVYHENDTRTKQVLSMVRRHLSIGADGSRSMFSSFGELEKGREGREEKEGGEERRGEGSQF